MTLTGGDGLYVKDCYGCTFVDLVLDDNYRQACSVISASDTLFENCQFLNTGAHDRLQEPLSRWAHTDGAVLQE